MLLNAKPVLKKIYIGISWQVAFRLDDENDILFYTRPHVNSVFTLYIYIYICYILTKILSFT